jgi:hypothetical protein
MTPMTEELRLTAVEICDYTQWFSYHCVSFFRIFGVSTPLIANFCYYYHHHDRHHHYYIQIGSIIRIFIIFADSHACTYILL